MQSQTVVQQIECNQTGDQTDTTDRTTLPVNAVSGYADVVSCNVLFSHYDVLYIGKTVEMDAPMFMT